MPISSKSLKIVRATAPLVAENSTKITDTFYPNHLFKNYPVVLEYFNPVNQQTGKQSAALGGAVAAFGCNIDNLSVLNPVLDTMALKHCALNVKPELYPAVRDSLLGACVEVLGNAITPQVAEAWSESIDELSAILIDLEDKLYAKASARIGGFKGEKEFVVTKRTEISKDAMEFQFQPKGETNETIFEYMPGQFLTLRAPGVLAPRHYTVTSKPNHDNFLSCCIKKVNSPPHTDEIPAGEMSSHVHALLQEGDTVKLTTPYGEFLPHTEQHPAVLFSAGIGITPMSSFVRYFQDKEVKVTSVHIDRSPDYHAYIDRFSKVDEKFWFYTEVDSRPAMPSVVSNVVSKQDDDTVYYICGPPTFMLETRQSLLNNGIGDDQVRWEAFGPALSA